MQLRDGRRPVETLGGVVEPAGQRCLGRIDGERVATVDEDRRGSSHPRLLRLGGRCNLDIADVHRQSGAGEGLPQPRSGSLDVRTIGQMKDVNPHASYCKHSSIQEGQVMLIGEVARRSGVSAKTLRYYEDIGVLDPAGRSTSGYRHYDDDVLERLAFIRSSQALGLTLGEIRSVVAMRDKGEAPCSHVLDLLLARANDIEHTIRDLRALRDELDHLVDRAEQLDPADCDPRRICHLIG